TEHAAHLLGLGITGTDVVENVVTKDMFARICTLDMLALPADVAAELKLGVRALAEGWPLELTITTPHDKPDELVIDRLTIQGINNPIMGAGIHRLERRLRVRRTHRTQAARGRKTLAQMQLEAGTVAHLWRRLNGRTQMHGSPLTYSLYRRFCK